MYILDSADDLDSWFLIVAAWKHFAVWEERIVDVDRIVLQYAVFYRLHHTILSTLDHSRHIAIKTNARLIAVKILTPLTISTQGNMHGKWKTEHKHPVVLKFLSRLKVLRNKSKLFVLSNIKSVQLKLFLTHKHLTDAIGLHKNYRVLLWPVCSSDNIILGGGLAQLV